MFGDEKSVGLLDVHKHLSDSINKISGNNSETKFDFEKESNCIFGISKKTIPMILDFRQALSPFQESSQNITMPYNECMELSSNLSGVAETIKNSILQIGNELEQYDHLLDQKLKNMYAVDVKQVDLVSVLNVAETFSAERNFSEKFHSAAKELTRTLDRDVKQIQKQLEENIKRSSTMSYNDIINGYEQKMNQSWDKLMYDPEHVNSNLYNTMYQHHYSLKELTKTITSEVGRVISSDYMINELMDAGFRDAIQDKVFQAQQHINSINERMNTVPQKYHEFCENATMFQNMVNNLSTTGNLDSLSEQDLDKISTMMDKNEDQIAYLNNVSSEMYNQSRFVMNEMENMEMLFCDKVHQLAQISNREVNQFIDDVADFVDKSNRFHTNIINELDRQKSERAIVEASLEQNKNAIAQIKEMSQEKEEIFIE